MAGDVFVDRFALTFDTLPVGCARLPTPPPADAALASSRTRFSSSRNSKSLFSASCKFGAPDSDAANVLCLIKGFLASATLAAVFSFFKNSSISLPIAYSTRRFQLAGFFFHAASSCSSIRLVWAVISAKFGKFLIQRFQRLLRFAGKLFHFLRSFQFSNASRRSFPIPYFAAGSNPIAGSIEKSNWWNRTRSLSAPVRFVIFNWYW